MKQFFLGLWILIVTVSCAAPAPKVTAPVAQASLSTDPFDGTLGCFLLYNVKTKEFDRVIGEEICRQRFPACSTFKVPLAAIAFDTGLLKDENTTYKWDGVKGDREAINKDHSAKSWMSDSVAWYSQRLTTKLGEKKLQRYLDLFKYGNRDISAGLKNAWLIPPGIDSKGLKISAYEQVDFMKQLWSSKLPVAKRVSKMTQDLTFLETTPAGFKFSGKTGSSANPTDPKAKFGWFVGHLKKENAEYIVVTNFTDLTPPKVEGPGGPRAKAITKILLEADKLW
jgi:beta-lactamase class D